MWEIVVLATGILVLVLSDIVLARRVAKLETKFEALYTSFERVFNERTTLIRAIRERMDNNDEDIPSS